ncbi:DUF1521 domain-containing protein [Kistimonas asteriae]|uniref:DUF1521 domain-containing protein n=1 Tax=Kistimonas asteriae TaxID=517724 RepID=UPI001BABBF77|nr:DUF1521 domain-containing protein [Kistimonas asteriae]
MSGQNIGSTGGIQGVDLKGIGEASGEKLSLADLMMQTMLDRSEMLDQQIRNQAALVKSQNDQIKQLNQIYSKLANHKTQTETVSKPTWTVDHEKDPKEIALDNGNKIVIHGNSEAWSIVDANGNSTKIWGDPHVSEGDRNGYWDFQSDGTFMLDDGTKIQVKTTAKDRKDGNVYTDSLTITKGNQSIEVTGIADNKPQIGEPALNGAMLDQATNDGHVFKMGDQADDWVYEGSELKLGSKITEERQHEEASAIDESSNVYNQVLTPEDAKLLEEVGVTVYDASGTGLLTPEEIANLQTQIKDMRDSVSSISNIELTKLDSYNKKYTQSLDLASTFMKSQYDQAKNIIRNIN